MPLLRLVFIAQLLVMLTGFIALLVTPANFQSVALLFYLVVIGSAVALYAAWQFIRHPDRRIWAAASIATPVVCLTSPFLIVALNGSPVAPGALFACAIALIVIAVVVLLWQKKCWQAGGYFTSRRLNTGFLIALAVLLVLYWTPIITWLYLQDSIKLPSTISERDNVLRIGAVYFVTIAGPAFIASLFALFYAPVGLVRNVSGRLVHLGQLILSLLTLTSLAIGAFVSAIVMFNPG